MPLKINHTKQKLGISDGVFSVTYQAVTYKEQLPHPSLNCIRITYRLQRKNKFGTPHGTHLTVFIKSLWH
jgi:hypothetical protein